MPPRPEAEARANRVVFCDSDLLVIKIWSEHSFGTCPEWILKRIDQQHYDLVLLMGVDIPWQPDPLREHPQLRQYFFDLYHRELREQMSNFAEISGDEDRRFDQACFLIDELLRTRPKALPSRSRSRAGSARQLYPHHPFCQATFAPHGAELTSLIARANGLEYLWQADPAVWARHAPVLFPLVGRLPDDAYHYEGRDYKLPQHGFARDQEFPVLRTAPPSWCFGCSTTKPPAPYSPLPSNSPLPTPCATPG